MNPIAAKALFDDEVARLPPSLLESRGWEVLSSTYPLLEIVFRTPPKEPLLLAMSFNKWNALPPSVVLLTAERTELAKPLQGGPRIFNASAHPLTGRPFICMAGVREYHTHTSHLRDRWESYRGQSGYDLGGIITRIWNGWLKTP